MCNISNRTVYNSQVVWIGEDLNLKITFNKDFLNYYLIRNLKRVGTQLWRRNHQCKLLKTRRKSKESVTEAQSINGRRHQRALQRL